MEDFKRNKSLSKITLLTVIILLMIFSVNLLQYLSKPHNNDTTKQVLSELPNMSPESTQEEAPNAEMIQPKQVKIILKVLPKNILFDLSMQKPEFLSLAKSESDEVQMMVDEGVEYQFKVKADNGKEEIVELKPAGQIEVHYVHF